MICSEGTLKFPEKALVNQLERRHTMSLCIFQVRLPQVTVASAKFSEFSMLETIRVCPRKVYHAGHEEESYSLKSSRTLLSFSAMSDHDDGTLHAAEKNTSVSKEGDSFGLNLTIVTCLVLFGGG